MKGIIAKIVELLLGTNNMNHNGSNQTGIHPDKHSKNKRRGTTRQKKDESTYSTDDYGNIIINAGIS